MGQTGKDQTDADGGGEIDVGQSIATRDEPFVGSDGNEEMDKHRPGKAEPEAPEPGSKAGFDYPVESEGNDGGRR